MQAENKFNFSSIFNFVSWNPAVAYIIAKKKITTSAARGAPWRLGALGPAPPGPLDKMALDLVAMKIKCKMLEWIGLYYQPNVDDVYKAIISCNLLISVACKLR